VVYDGPAKGLCIDTLRSIYGGEFHAAGGDDVAGALSVSVSAESPTRVQIAEREPALTA